MRRARAPLLLLAALVSLLAGPPRVEAFSLGPRFASTEASCTFLTCGEADGAADAVCSVSGTARTQVNLGGYGFAVPATAVITGIVVEPKAARSNTRAASVSLLKGGEIAGSTKSLAPVISAACADSAYSSLGTAADLWGTTWTPAEVNAPGFGVQVSSTQAMSLDAVRVTVHFDVPTPVCGDGLVTHDEACDDGNTARGDGCSARCEIEVVLDTAAQRCVNAMNADAVKVEAAQWRLALECLKSAQKGREADAQTCATSDGAGAVAKAAARTVADAGKGCATPPAFGFTSAGEVNAAGEAGALGLAADLLGADLTAAVVREASDKAGAACQAAVAAGAHKLVEARTGLFLKCKKQGLAAHTDPFVSGADIELCFESLTADSKGTVAQAADGLAATLAKKCAAADLGAVFPGACAGAAGAAAFVACMDARAACRVCQLFNAADGTRADCAAFAGLPPGSCS